MEEVTWAWVPGCEGRYRINTDGMVVSHVRTHPRTLKWYIRPDGYPSVCVFKARRNDLVHKLVALTFIGPRPEGKEIAHLDGNPGNPRLNNLAYVSHVENEGHKSLHGTLSRGTRNGCAKLDEHQVHQIMAWLTYGFRQRDIAEWFGVGQGTISKIKLGQRWAWNTPT